MSVKTIPVEQIQQAFKGVANVSSANVATNNDKETFSCQFCGQTASSGAGRSAHERWCKKNPERLLALNKKPATTVKSVGLDSVLALMEQRLSNSRVTFAEFSAWKSLTEELWFKG